MDARLTYPNRRDSLASITTITAMHTISESAYEGDIVSRLRNWRGLHLAHGGQLFDEAADEIARLRDSLDEQAGRASWNYDCLTQCEERVIQRDAEIDRLRLAISRLAEQDATLSVCEGSVTVTLDATLTPEEREAIGRAASFADDAAGYCREPENVDAARTQAATLRGLLERTSQAGIRNAARG